MPNTKEIKLALKNLHNAIKPNGHFFAIFPAMNAILYQAFLIHEKQRETSNTSTALKKTRLLLEKDKYNFLKATYTDQELTQKFYYDFELEIRLKDAGFKDIKNRKSLVSLGRFNF